MTASRIRTSASRWAHRLRSYHHPSRQSELLEGLRAHMYLSGLRIFPSLLPISVCFTLGLLFLIYPCNPTYSSPQQRITLFTPSYQRSYPRNDSPTYIPNSRTVAASDSSMCRGGWWITGCFAAFSEMVMGFVSHVGLSGLQRGRGQAVIMRVSMYEVRRVLSAHFGSLAKARCADVCA